MNSQLLSSVLRVSLSPFTGEGTPFVPRAQFGRDKVRQGTIPDKLKKYDHVNMMNTAAPVDDNVMSITISGLS